MRRFFSFVLLFHFFATGVFAQSPTISISDSESTPSMQLVNEKVEYELAYPGILPDNPLYKIKAFRDRVIGFLISDKRKKAEFYILQADKRLNAGIYLVKKNENSLAIDTISKGVNYFHDALGRLESARSDGSDIVPLSERVYLSVRKHEEVLKNLSKDMKGSEKKQIENELNRILQYKKDIDKLKKDTR